MRMIGLVLALGAMGWVLYQAAGGKDAETIIPEAHQQSMEKAQNLEAEIQATVNSRLEGLEEE